MDAVDHALFDRLRRFTGFSDADSAALRRAAGAVRASFPGLVGDFQERVLAEDATRRLLGDAQSIDRLGVCLTRWLEGFFTQPRDRAFLADRLHQASAHARVGLHPSFMVAAFGHMRAALTGAIARAVDLTPAERDAAGAAAQRALDLELALNSQFQLEADRYRELVEAAPVMIHQLDRAGRVMLMNRMELERLGYQREAVLGQPFSRYVRADHQEILRHHLDHVAQQGHGRCELALHTHDGRFLQVEIVSTAVRDPLDGQVVASRAYVQDLSTHKRIERELDRERQMERRYLDVASVMFVVLDRNGNVQVINRRACELLKVTEEEAIGSNWFDRFIAPEHRDEIRRAFHELMQGQIQALEFYENPVQASDGERRLIEWHNAVMTDEHGCVVGTLSSGTDVTERRQLLKKLAERDSLARLGEMAAVVAHEVRNPLAGISGALQIVQGNLPPASDDRELLGQVLQRIDALDEKVEDLLMFARPRPPARMAIPVRAVLQSTIALFRADPRIAEVEVDLAGADPVVHADPELLEQVFLNLLVNAAQAMQGRGRIAIAVETPHDECRVSVADSGPGIPPGVRDRVFEPFFTTKHRGTGLGLPTAQRIIAAHGGRISFVCPAGGGTTFHVALPTTPVEADRVPAETEKRKG